MQFPESPTEGDQVTNPSTGAVYQWDGAIWVNVPPDCTGGGAGVSDEDRDALIADQNRQDLALRQETTDRMDRDKALQDQLDALQAYDDSALADGLAAEIKAREDGDTALQDQLNALEPYDDSGLIADQQRQDQALQDHQAEIAKQQAAQDKALTDYQTVVADQQAAQDAVLKEEQAKRAERDALHDAQLATVEYKLDALMGLQFRGVYTFKHDADCDAAYAACMAAAAGDPTAGQQCGRDLISCENGKVSSGTFEAVDPDDRFDHLEAIVIHKNAIDGEELEWDSILKAGDYLEIDHKGADGLDKQNYGLYRLTADPEQATNAAGEPVFDIQLEFLQGEGELKANESYECRGITAAEGVSPEELGDFLLKDEAASTYALKSHSHSNYISKEADDSSYKDWLLKAGGGKRNPADFAGSSHTHDYAATNHSHNYLPLSGGTLAGALNMQDAAAIKTRQLDSGNNSDLQIKRNGQRRILVGTDVVLFDKIPQCGTNPSADNDLTRKGWIANNYAAKSHTHDYAAKTHSHTNYASSSHTHSGYASSSHSHSGYVKGSFTITSSNGNYYIS